MTPERLHRARISLLSDRADANLMLIWMFERMEGKR